MQIGSFPEFGANGVAVAPDGSALFVANMSSDIIYRVGFVDYGGTKGCQPGPLSVFVKGQGINGPDNIFFDEGGLLWVASGRNDRVVAIDPTGKIVSKVGIFQGLTPAGAPIGLMQPSGIVVSNGRVYVGNESSRALRPTPDLIPDSVWDELFLFTVVEIRPFIQR